MATEHLLNKWQTLDQEDQEKVLIFIESLAKTTKNESENPKQLSENLSENNQINYQPKTELGKKLWKIRQRIIADPNVKLLTLDEINSELDETRGRNRY